MKLGSQTGSVTNHLYSRMVIGQPEPEVGMGCTILCWTDRHAATIIDVFKKGKSTYIKVQEDRCKRTDKNGMSENQDYEYTPNPEGPISYFKREDDGRWSECRYNEETRRYKKCDGSGLRLGVRDAYHDYSF